MNETIIGTANGIALVAFVPVALAVTALGWSHAWIVAFDASGVIAILGAIAALLVYPTDTPTT